MTDRFVIQLTLIINIINELYNFTYLIINLPFINYDYYKIILRKSVIISYRCSRPTTESIYKVQP